jgi:hypothetical protein
MKPGWKVGLPICTTGYTVEHIGRSPHEAWRQKVARGDVIVIRYADDLVVGFENRTEAKRFLEAFRERLAKFGLEIHPKGSRRPLRSWVSRTTAGNAGAMEHRATRIFKRWIPAPRVLHP